MTAPLAPPGYKTEACAVVAEYIPARARVVEVGAGLGVVTEALCRRGGYVMACEPVPCMHDAAYHRMMDAAPTGLNWTLVQAAAGPRGCPDQVELHEMSEPWNSGVHIPPYDRPVRTFTCPQVELDVLVRSVRADTLVCDAEGAECALLTGSDLLPLQTLMIEWHPHIVGGGPVAEAKLRLHAEGFVPVVERRGQLRPGGFAELAVYRREP